MEIRDALLVDAAETAAPPQPPLPAAPPQQQEPQPQQLHGIWVAMDNQQGRTEQQQQGPQQLPDQYGGLRLPTAPSTPLCALAPGPGVQETELLHQLISNAYLDAAWNRTQDASPRPSLPPPTPTASSWWPPPPLLQQFFANGLGNYVYPYDVSYTLPLIGVTRCGTVLCRDARLETSNGYMDLYNFLRNQAVVQLPGTLLLGDPVRVRTLDLASFPSAVVLEREPLARAASKWPSPDVLLPFLDSVRQQRQAAGLRGLLTEPVSLTVRHLVLINLPAAGPFVRILPPPVQPASADWQPPEEGSRRLLLMESAGTDGAMDVRVAGRGIQQVPQLAGEGGGANTAGGAGAAAATNPDVDYLGGLPPSLANLTSCVWSLQLDRAAVVRAVRDRLQQGGTHGGGGAGDSSSSSVQSPVDVSYVLLQSVQLVVPERELLLLAWAWATNATRHAAHPGLAEQLQLMLDGSRLAGGPGAAVAALQQLLREPLGSPGGPPAPTLPAGLRLVFDQFVWCGLLGTNVTLTLQLPGPTQLSLQLPDLDLPVAYGRGLGAEPQGGNRASEAPPPWVALPPVAVPQPSSGPLGGQGTPAAASGNDGRQGAAGGAPVGGAGDTGSVAPGSSSNGTGQQPAATAAAAAAAAAASQRLACSTPR